MDRLKEYYEDNKIIVIAEFYIEDLEDVQITKIKALANFLSTFKY